MGIVAALRRLWRHRPFRRLLTLRILSQAADGTLQVGMASYVLFSPQSQPDAWAIAAVLALTYLPYTVVGPFVSPLLDRWSRRNVALYSDLARAALALLVAAVILLGLTGGGWAVALFGGLLLAMSINRFMLAGLSAGLQHTVDDDEFLTASSIVPTVGPLGVVIGALLGFVVRFALGATLDAHQGDAVVFLLAAAMFTGSVLVCRGFAAADLGPGQGGVAAGAGEVWRGLHETARHLAGRPAATLGLALMALTRLLFGLLSVMTILTARHLWHPVERPAAALADLTLWGVATGAGFVLAAGLVPVLVRWLGLRRTAAGLLLGGAAVCLAMAPTSHKGVVIAGSLATGVVVQSFKICVDTLVQAHVDEDHKGRAFTFYDVAFNAAFVAAGLVAAWWLPATGFSSAAFVGMALAYAAAAVTLLLVSARLGPRLLERGTEDLAASPTKG